MDLAGLLPIGTLLSAYPESGSRATRTLVILRYGPKGSLTECGSRRRSPAHRLGARHRLCHRLRLPKLCIAARERILAQQMVPGDPAQEITATRTEEE